jgi:hypothetical protein
MRVARLEVDLRSLLELTITGGRSGARLSRRSISPLDSFRYCVISGSAPGSNGLVALPEQSRLLLSPCDRVQFPTPLIALIHGRPRVSLSARGAVFGERLEDWHSLGPSFGTREK